MCTLYSFIYSKLYWRDMLQSLQKLVKKVLTLDMIVNIHLSASNRQVSKSRLCVMFFKIILNLGRE